MLLPWFNVTSSDISKRNETLFVVTFRLVFVVDVVSHLPDLHHVVRSNAADHPGLVLVPAEVRDLGSVTSVDEEKFWRSLCSLLSTLLLSNLVEIPDVKPPVSPRAGQDSLVVWRPLDLKDLLLVTLKAVQFKLEVPEVPESHSFVSGAGGEDVF